MCLHPLSIKTVDSFNMPINQSVPCGKCLECLKDKQNSWKIRLQEESRDHLYVYFFTLTYNDDSVPFVYDSSGNKILHVCKSDIQSWIKRNRIRFERLFHRSIDFKYFVASEYGPNTARPHYHGIIFTDITPTFISMMFNDWSSRYGFTNFSEVGKLGNRKTRSRISSVGNYVAKYCAKPIVFKSPAELSLDEHIKIGLIPRTFYLMSKGLGVNYINRMKRFHVPFINSPSERIGKVCDRAFYHDGAFKYKLPRYFRDRLYRRKFPYEVKLWNNKKKCYEEKIVYRYASKNPLSIQMQVEIRNRIMADYYKRVAEFRSCNPSISDTEVHIALARSEANSIMDRQKNIYSKMSRFYNYSRFKHCKL